MALKHALTHGYGVSDDVCISEANISCGAGPVDIRWRRGSGPCLVNLYTFESRATLRPAEYKCILYLFLVVIRDPMLCL